LLYELEDELCQRKSVTKSSSST